MMGTAQRSDITNAIWLCQNCAKLIDNDQVRFTAGLLQTWKVMAEGAARDQIGKAAGLRDGEQISDKWVNLQYPEKAGITKNLTAAGWLVRWRAANEESELVDLEGWEPVLLDLPDGTRARLKIRDHPVIGGYLILLKRKS